MTTIIISILAALGIGGGVMLASSGGGGSSSGGAAVVAPVNPGGNGGGSSGGQNGGSTGSSTGGSNNPQPVLSSVMAMSKNAQLNINKNGQEITLTLEPLAPTLDPNGNGSTDYITNIVFDKVKTDPRFRHIIGYGTTNPKITGSLNLGQITKSENLADYYTLAKQIKTLPNLKFSYINGYFANSDSIQNYNFTDVTWTLYTTVALGGRQLGLENSDFGYYKWTSQFLNTEISNNSNKRRRAMRYGAQQFYMFDPNKQFIGNAQDYISRYGNTAHFEGNVIGTYYYVEASCWTSSPATEFYGTINLDFNFKTKSLTGSVASSKANLSLTGKIQDITSNTPNFIINDIGNSSAIPQNNAQNYGGGVFVKGSNNNGSKDEVVGEIAYSTSRIDPATCSSCLDVIYQTNYINMGFGAKKQ